MMQQPFGWHRTAATAVFSRKCDDFEQNAGQRAAERQSGRSGEQSRDDALDKKASVLATDDCTCELSISARIYADYACK